MPGVTGELSTPCILTQDFRYYLQIDPTLCTYNGWKIQSKLPSNMFRWRPPPPSGKSNSTHQHTPPLYCLSYHAHCQINSVAPNNTCCTQLHSTREGDELVGAGTCIILGIHQCVCARLFMSHFPRMYLYKIFGFHTDSVENLELVCCYAERQCF